MQDSNDMWSTLEASISFTDISERIEHKYNEKNMHTESECLPQ